MNAKDMFVEVGYNSLNKKQEELCGDKVEVFQSENRTIIVLADGLGSGVKANILATLTSKIAITMLKKGANIEEVIDTIAHTLPVCKVRRIAYSTFSIIEIDDQLNCKIFESENPSFFFLRGGKIIEDPKKLELHIMDKTVLLTELKLQENDLIYICSDGVIHAGVGKELNFGWQWEHVAKYLEKAKGLNAELLSRRLLDACDELYQYEPGDDTTVVAVKVRKPVFVLLFTGPPINPNLDTPFVKKFMRQKGRKVVCGGTAANIVSRELDREIKTSIDYEDISIPPVAFIEGIDLVTEGVFTIKRTIELLEQYAEHKLKIDDLGRDGGSQLFSVLVEQGTHIEFWLGKALNSAHQTIDFPSELSMKINVVKELVKSLEKVGKVATIKYIAEVNDETI